VAVSLLNSALEAYGNALRQAVLMSFILNNQRISAAWRHFYGLATLWVISGTGYGLSHISFRLPRDLQVLAVSLGRLVFGFVELSVPALLQLPDRFTHKRAEARL
jgi:hypothetical protein